MAQRLRLILEKCTGCGTCTSRCPLNLITVKRGRIHIKHGCGHCGNCAKACEYGAIRLENADD